MRTFGLATTLGALTWAAACSDSPVEPAAYARPAFAMGGAAACPTPANVTVSDEAGLRAALSAATPGKVIAVDGLFDVGAEITIATDGVTLTCATSGSGLRARPGAGIIRMIVVTGRRITVERLVLDGRGAAGGPYRAVNDQLTAFAEEPRLLGNRVFCGAGPDFEGGCALFDGTRRAVVADNHFESPGTISGVHMQVNPDFFPILIGDVSGSRIVGNTVVATGASPFLATHGGLRIRDGVAVVIADNVVTGPWSNSLSMANIADGVIERNRLAGAQAYGIRAVKDQFVAIATTRDVFRSNTVEQAGAGGIFLSVACNNEFLGNNLQHTAPGIGFIFDVPTGANRYAGNPNVVVDNGNFDCDGDGVPDPNVITGPGGKGAS